MKHTSNRWAAADAEERRVLRYLEFPTIYTLYNLQVKIGSGHSHSLCYGGTMGNGYFGTSQARKDKRKSKDFTYNYVDRIRLAEDSLQDQNYPVRGSGWRHRSVSHLDLATSCHGAASGPNHWPLQRQLRPSRSLDYNHIRRYEDALDIAECRCRIDPEEHYDARQGGHKTRYQHKDVVLYRDYAGESFHSTNSIYTQQHQQEQPQKQLTHTQPFDVGNDSCSLRRSRSLAVIREETFNDLHITATSSGCRRSQLIPRARLVNRGFFREHEARFNCANSKRHHHHNSQEKLTNDTEQDASNSVGGAAICDPHLGPAQHHYHDHHNQSTAHPHQLREAEDYYDNLKRLDAAAGAAEEHLHPWHNDKSDLESLNSDYFKNSLHQGHELKQQQQPHPQQDQQRHQQQHLEQQHLEKELAENAPTLRRGEKPRIYQSKRSQQRSLAEKHTSLIQQQASKLQAANCPDSCPETSQSSVFPETTTSNSDDQSDSLSCSEQEYDLTRIEAIYEQKKLERDDEESYELISLTTTTRTCIEAEDEDNSKPQNELQEHQPHSIEDTSQLDDEFRGTLKRTRALSENLEKLISYDSIYLSSEESSGSTLIDEHTEACENLDAFELIGQAQRTKTTLLHISIEDTVFDSPLHSCGEHQSEDDVVSDENVKEETHHNGPNGHQNVEAPKQSDNKDVNKPVPVETPLYTQILKIEPATPSTLFTTTTSTVTCIPSANTTSQATKPRKLTVVEKRKQKRNADCLNTSFKEHQHNIPGSSALKNRFKANLIHNQYHSLPDVNIGKSLKVSERIDAKLRSSYNVSKYQATVEDISNCRPRNLPVKQKADVEVTTAEIYDSIKKFGQEHQKARLQEYEELYEETVIREEVGVREKKQRLEKTEINTGTYTKELKVIEEQNSNNVESNTESSSVEIHEVSLESVSEINIRKVSIAEPEVIESLAENTSESEPTIDVNDYEEQPKEAPSIEVPHFTREIERRAKEIQQIAAENKARKEQQTQEKDSQSQTFTSATFRVSKSTNNLPDSHPCKNANEVAVNPFRIIVTDAHNKVIAEDSIEGKHIESEKCSTIKASQVRKAQSESDKVEIFHRIQTKDVALSRSKSAIQSHSKTATSSLKRVPSKPKRAHICGQQYQHQSNQDLESSSQKSKDRRTLITQIYKARPVKVLATNESFRRVGLSTKMSRPQILHVVDNKRNSNIAAAKCRLPENVAVSSLPQIGENQVENEYMKKVDAVRCYWSKLAEEEQKPEEEKQLNAKSKNNKEQQEEKLQNQQLLATGKECALGTHNENHHPRHFHFGVQQETHAKNSNESDTRKAEERSFMPSIEIVELNGEKTAAIVSAVSPNATADTLSNEAKEPQFDHIRYKVMKSQQLLRSNILARHKKEAQFDGLIQYLQDYSFQELLSNNNVVIVEPVRTKIERPSQTAHKPNANGINVENARITSPSKEKERNQRAAKPCREETSAKKVPVTENKPSGVIKRHFFYQPVRVNRELYEEELPHPDTVRNVRKFFEENILPTPGRGITVHRCRPSNSKSQTYHEGAQEYPQLSPRSSRIRKYRYLTIDTSYGQSGEDIAAPHQQASRKWDSASLSSGISSGDLSSPCECNDGDASAAGQLIAETNEIQPQRYQRPVCEPDELKGVHVKDVVRRHNTTNEGQKQESEMIRGANGRRSRYPRYIYEYKTGKDDGTMEESCIHSRRDAREMLLDEDVDVDDDEEDNELSESYYVSNDILEKIRECGSSVTYYGGRVLQKSFTEPHHESSPVENSAALGTLNPGGSTMTLTRGRAKQFETCRVCRANLCQEDEHLKDKPTDNTNMERSQDEVPLESRINNYGAYWGVRFKLIKSNSCSSRLELAGTEEDVTEDAEVVKDIVKRLEAAKNTEGECKLKRNLVKKLPKQPNNNGRSKIWLTINNQMANEASDGSRFTVNNHINVAVPAASSAHLDAVKIRKSLPSEASGSIVEGDQVKAEIERGNKLQNDAMNMLLEEAEGNNKKTGNNRRSSSNNTGTGTKVCRNKNVDLAFVMTKQQQSHRSNVAMKDSRKSNSFHPTLQSTLEHAQLEKDIKNATTDCQQSKGNEVINASSLNKCATKTFEPDKPTNTSNTLTTGDTTKVKFTEPPDKGMKRDSSKSLSKSKAKVTIPGEMHQRTVQLTEPSRISSGEEKSPSQHVSSSMATIDKAFVRHYVANDKSLLERRKYDEIEFEEFEVYDPSKDADRVMSRGETSNKPQKTPSVGDLPSLNDDDK